MYIFCFVLFNAANIALALQNSFVALLILRMVQSAGSSGTVALANGVVGDIITSSERGTYVAYTSLGPIFGPMIAPVLGGIIGQYAGWHFIFWFLFIFSAAVFIPLILFLPETCRKVVDNGSIPPPFFSQNITDLIRHKRRAKAGLTYDEAKLAEIKRKYKFRLPSPMSTVAVLLDLESACILVATGLGLGCFYAIRYSFSFPIATKKKLTNQSCSSTGASKVFSSLYGFNQLKISLMFLPIGFGSMASAFTIGKLVDWNYRRFAKKLGVPVIKNRVQDLAHFPIEKARLQVAFPATCIAASFIIMYGWVMAQKLSLAAPIIALFFAGFGLTASFQTLNILMVDIYPGKPSVATAANNFVRCEIGAVFSAIIIPLSDAIGTGWAYTILAAMFIGFNPVLLIIVRKGPGWRRARKEKEDKVELQKEEKATRKEEQRVQQQNQS